MPGPPRRPIWQRPITKPSIRSVARPPRRFAPPFLWSSRGCKLHRTGGFWHITRCTQRALSKAPALHPLFEVVGAVAAILTTLCWLPQIRKILRERKTSDISLGTNAALATGISLWIVYGLAIGSLPVILSNAVTLLFILTIVGLKLRYG